MKRKTSRQRFSRALCAINQSCRADRHPEVRDQYQAMVKKLHGHYEYYGITGNSEALRRFLLEVKRYGRSGSVVDHNKVTLTGPALRNCWSATHVHTAARIGRPQRHSPLSSKMKTKPSGCSRRGCRLILRSGLRPALRISLHNHPRFSHKDWYKNPEGVSTRC